MSLRTKQNRRSGHYVSSGGFSSKSIGSIPVPKASTTDNVAITPITINKSLLSLPKTDIDDGAKALRTEEKDQIKGLNNKFASYIKKVQLLEQQNKILETKWDLLQKQTAPSSDVEPMFKAYIANLQKQLDLVYNDKTKLEMDKTHFLCQVDNYKAKYEEEINKRAEAEQTFVELRKDMNQNVLSKMNLESKVSSLQDDFNFLHAVHGAELNEMQGALKNTSVIVEMDNTRSLDMDQIVSEVKAQFEEMAADKRREVESWYSEKLNQMTSHAVQHENEVRSSRQDLADLKRLINRIQHEIDVTRGECSTIERTLTEVEENGETAVMDANDRIKKLEKVLMDNKHLMAKQLRDYQELMNTKYALDIEISTYKKMIEEEEKRIGQQTVVNVRPAPIRNQSSAPSKTNLTRRRSGPILIKTIETHDISHN